MHILVVEDEHKIAQLLQDYLHHEGMTSTHLSRGDAVEPWLAQQHADLLLLVNRLTGAAFISYEDPEMELGLSLLVQVGLLTQERKDAIVQLMLPPALRG